MAYLLILPLVQVGLSSVDKQAMVVDWLNPEQEGGAGGVAAGGGGGGETAPQVQHKHAGAGDPACPGPGTAEHNYPCPNTSAQQKFSKVNRKKYLCPVSHLLSSDCRRAVPAHGPRVPRIHPRQPAVPRRAQRQRRVASRQLRGPGTRTPRRQAEVARHGGRRNLWRGRDLGWQADHPMQATQGGRLELNVWPPKYSCETLGTGNVIKIFSVSTRILFFMNLFILPKINVIRYNSCLHLISISTQSIMMERSWLPYVTNYHLLLASLSISEMSTDIW